MVQGLLGDALMGQTAQNITQHLMNLGLESLGLSGYAYSNGNAVAQVASVLNFGLSYAASGPKSVISAARGVKKTHLASTASAPKTTTTTTPTVPSSLDIIRNKRAANEAAPKTTGAPLSSAPQKSTAKTIDLASEVGEYRQVRGHHVHAKKAFEGDVNYDPKKGFSMSEKLMESLDARHYDITGSQKKLFTALEKSGRPNTMKEHTRIAVEALTENKVPRETARNLAAQSLNSLRKEGVRAPTNIPWSKK